MIGSIGGTAGKVRTYRSPSGEWFARAKYRDFDGSAREVQRQGRKKAIAERLLAEAIRDRSLVFGSGTLRSDSTVKQLADAWWDDIRLSDRSPSTLDAYRGSLDRYVLPCLGQLRVRELRPSVVDRFLRSITSASSAKMARSVVSGLGGFAVRQDLLEHNPARDLTLITRQRKKPAATLTLGELRDLRAQLVTDEFAVSHDLVDLISFLMATGLRIGEAIALTWDAVDLDEGTVEVRGTVIRLTGQGLLLKPKPKTKAGYRTLLLPIWCVDMLRARHQQRRRGAEAKDPVFASMGGRLRDPKNTNRDLRRAYDTAGRPEISSHAFRRSVATAMDAAGLTARMAADQLGHEKISMTADVYFGRRTRDTGAATVLQALADQPALAGPATPPRSECVSCAHGTGG
jgi:integrase